MKYKTILVDPPWQYRNKKTGGSMISGSESKYPTMSLDELLKLPIQNLSDRDCVLFLWATTPLLPEAFQLMKGWNFTYKTAIFWRKIMSLGMGFWFRGQMEMCLLGIKGKVKAFRAQRCNVIQSKALKHSQKPVELYDLIEPYILDPKIELFARNRREGWDVWGNEIDNDINMEDYI